MRRIKRLYLFFVKNCWSRLWNRQFLTFLFFLLLSSVFWFLQSGYETVEREFSIPVRLVGVPDNVVLTTDPPHFRSRHVARPRPHADQLPLFP